jgi:hypothetical protein
MNIIFLDVDGVLNSEEFEVYHPEFCFGLDIYQRELDTLALIRLQKLVQSTNSVVVISSSWKHSKGLPVLIAALNSYNIGVVGITGHVDSRIRGIEIKNWIDDNINLVDSYLILDDDEDMLYMQKDNFIHIDNKYGLTDKDVAKGISILNGE